MASHGFLFPSRQRWSLLAFSLAGLLCSGTVSAQQTYYGAPYSVQSAVLVGSYQTLGEATAALQAAWLPHCPTCTITAAYFDPSKDGDVAAAVILNPNSSSPTKDGIFATERIDDPKRVAGACLVCSAGTGQTMAGMSPTNSSGDAAKDNAHGSADGLFGADPVNFGTGSKFQQETDFRGGAWLTFRRFYNGHTPVPGAEMGALWRHTFDRSIEVLKSTPGASAGSIDQLVLDRPDGSSETFTHGTNGWIPSSDDPDTVIEQVDGSGNTTGYSVFMVGTRQTEQYSAAGQLQSITDLSGTVTTLTYSDATTPATVAPKPGLLLTVTAPNGRALSFIYDASARVQTITLPDGGTLGYAYDTNNNLTSVTYPDTHTKQYVYNESALVGASLPNAMTGIIDEKGTRFETTSYNSSGQAISTQFALGADKTTFDIFNFSENGVIPVDVTTPLGFTYEPSLVNFLGGFKAAGSSANCGQTCGQPWKSVTYDTNGWPASFTDYNGNQTLTTNNAVGLETQKVEASSTPIQRTTNTTWDNVLRNPLTRNVSDANNHVVSQEGWVYNTRGQTLASCEMDPTIPAAASYVCSNTGTVPAGVRRTVYTYCDAVDTTQCPLIGLMLTKKGPRTDIDDTTHYSYYMDDNALHQHGDLANITNALGHQTNYIGYDGAGRVTTMSDQNGTISTLSYNPRGWLLSRSINPFGVDEATSSFTYTPFGALETVTDPDGVVTTYGYDDAHRLIKITDGEGNFIQYTLDAVGNRTAENIYTSGGSTPVHSLTRQFNAQGQLVKTIDGLSHTTLDATATGSYDLNGNLVQSKDGLGFVRKQTFDALDRAVSDVENFNGIDTATQNTTTGKAYDALDRLTQVTDPANLATNYTFDGLSNQTNLQSPDTGNSSDTFDAAGNRLTHTDAKGVIGTSTYDALNRLLTTTFSDSTLNVSYHYDESVEATGCHSNQTKGHLTRMVESTVTTTYCYDSRGNVSQKIQTQGTQADVTSYAYTPADRLSQVTYPSGTVVQYTRNNLGQITSVTSTPSGGAAQTVVSNATYLPFGPVSSYTLGNGQVVSRNYDANYQLVDLTSPNFNLHFTRDVMGDIKSLGNAPGVPTPTETYTYDPLYRLIGVLDSQGNVVESYTYNQTGDRLSKTSAGGLATGTYGYQSGTHLLTSIGSSARSYDLNGNTTGNATGGQTFGFGYDGRNRLALAQANNVTVGTYTYNALGERVAKATTSPQANGRFDYDEGGQILGEYGSSNRDYIWMDDLPIGAVDGTGAATVLNFVVADGLGAPRSVNNSVGTQIWQWQYQGNSFGEKQPTSTNGYVFNLRFPGQYFDTERGVAYNVNRDYDASIGRYLQSDPMGLAAGPSTFAYVTNNPLLGIDPLGLCDQEDRCEQQIQEDEEVCRSLPNNTSYDKRVREACWSSANERYGACAAKRPIPRLVTSLSVVHEPDKDPVNRPVRRPVAPVLTVEPVSPPPTTITKVPELPPLFEPIW